MQHSNLKCQNSLGMSAESCLNYCNLDIYLCKIHVEYINLRETEGHYNFYHVDLKTVLHQVSLQARIQDYHYYRFIMQIKMQFTYNYLSPIPYPLLPTHSTPIPPHFPVYKANGGVYNVSLSTNRHAGYRRAH